jgi:lipoyl(octanoyl) transferase
VRALRSDRLGAAVPFAAALARQREIVARLTESAAPEAHLLLLEHAPVYTLGRTTRPEHLLLSEEGLRNRTGAEVVRVDRGGSVTYHGPGQLTAYLLLNLNAWKLDLHRHLRNLEAVAAGALRGFGLTGRSFPKLTGVWVEPPGQPPAKVCAIGVGCRRWVTCHGLSLNVNLDLAPFGLIDPCGLGHRPVTSLAILLGRKVGMEEAADAVARSCAEALRAKLRA